MLELARKRLDGKPVTFLQQNLSDIDNLKLPESNYQIAITSFVLHEVTADIKKRVFRFIYNALSEGGIYILLDRFKIDSDGLKPGYASQWNHTVHPEWKADLSFEDYSKKMSEKEDSPDKLENVLTWLRETGFKADCLKLELDRALIFAIK